MYEGQAARLKYVYIIPRGMHISASLIDNHKITDIYIITAGGHSPAVLIIIEV